MKIGKAGWIALGVVILLLAGWAGYAWYERSRALPEGLLQANGRIEGDQIALASKFAGRIAELKVREGDAVKAGQVVAVLDAEQVAAKVAQAKSAVGALEAQQRAADTGLAALRKQVPLEIDSAQTGVAQAEAMLRKARAGAEQSERDAKRLEELAARGSVPQQRAELARLAATASDSDVAAAQEGLTRARKLHAQALLGTDRLKAKQDELAALTAQVAQVRATLAEAQSVQNDLTIKAPTDGVIMTRIRDVGEVVAAGSPIFSLVDLDHLYVKVYVPEVQIGQLRLNLPAQVYTDAYPDTAFAATVKFISSRAEFTPKEVQTVDERVKLTYAVKLYFDRNPDHKLTPGLPADAVIRWKEGVEWAKPRW